MILKMNQPAPDEHTRYARDAFSSKIGKQIGFRTLDGRYHMAYLVAAEVAPDGSSVKLTIDVPDLEIILPGSGHYSIDGMTPSGGRQKAE